MPRPDPLPAAPVVTVLTPDERVRVDAAGVGLYRTLHRETVEDVLRDLRNRRAAAVVVSVACCTSRDAARVATMVREFPRVPAVALLTQVERGTPEAVLSLGRSGVEHLVDVRGPGGWHALREVLGRDRSDPLGSLVVESLGRDLAGAPRDCLRFFALLFQETPRLTTVRALARRLGVVPSTLMSRFFRSGLPTPKRYLALSRLVRAAQLFENPGLSVASVSNTLDYSSPQSFGRHVRTTLHMTAGEFRERYDGEGMFQCFRSELVLPFLPALRRFTPFDVPPGWLDERSRRRLTGASEELEEARVS